MASCLLQREAFAQGSELEYSAPATCPSAAEFSARVARTLQQPLVDFERLGRFRVTIAPAPPGYQLTVVSEVRGERGMRVLSGPDCNSVADAGALSVAIALSGAAEAEDGAQPPEASAGVESKAPAPSTGLILPKTPAPSTEPSLRVVVTEPETPSRNTLTFQVLGDYGALPHVSAGFRLSAGRAGQRWSGRFGIAALLPATRSFDGERGTVGGRFWLGTGRAEGCLRTLGDARTSLDGCLVFEGGALTGSGVGVDVPKQVTLVWLAPGARVAGALPLPTGQAHAVLGAEGLVPLLSKRFTIENGRNTLHQPARWVSRVDLGVAWPF